MNIFVSRINGYALLMFFLGIISYKIFGNNIYVVGIPTFLLWLMIHDEICYRRFRRKGGEEE